MCTVLIPKAFSAWLIFYMGPLHVAPGSAVFRPRSVYTHRAANLFELCVTAGVKVKETMAYYRCESVDASGLET